MFGSSSLGKEFIAQFKKLHPGIDFHVQDNAELGSVFVVAAVHPEVGDLYVSDDGDELGLFVGDLIHWHVSAHQFDDLAATELTAAIAGRAIEDIGILISGRQMIRVRYSESGKIASSRISAMEDLTRARNPDERDFLWSGPLT